MITSKLNTVEWQPAKVSVLSSGKVKKYELLIGEDFLLEKGLLGKSVTIKRCQYLSLGSELKNQTDIAKDQYKLLKNQKNNVTDNIREDGDNENDESSITKM